MSIMPLPLPPFSSVWFHADEGSRSSARGEGKPQRSPSPRRHGTPVLVVDDDESILDMLRAVLSADGYSVQVAPDGAAALELVEKQPPAVVLLDMRLPKVNGWEFARRLRDRGLRVPIVAMTAGRDAPKAAREIEADEFLTKPFEIDELLEKVSRFRIQPPNN